MSEEQMTQAPEKKARRWPAALVGFVLGVVATAAITEAAMRGLMIVEHESTKGLDETVAAIEARIKAEGWASPGTMDMNKAMAKHGVEFKPQVRLIKLCKAPYAKEVLTDSRQMAALMPCTIAVYEGDDGKVYVSKMNTGLMGKVFGGTIARVMGGKVGPEEARILEGIVR